jgi:2,3,4,5-tetrahydropyridine-2-carboxylate N-succinyltransferase
MTLERRISALAEQESPERSPENLELLAELRAALNCGEIRVAEPMDSGWRINVWVKHGLLLHLVLGELRDPSCDGDGRNFEFDTFPGRRFTPAEQVRVSPGARVRDGCYLGPNVGCLPHSFVNMGAYIGRETAIDAGVNIGLCAQIGERVVLHSGSQVGGFLNPLSRLPTVLGNDVVLGGNCGVFDGVMVSTGAVLSAGTVLHSQSRVYDVTKRHYHKAVGDQPLVIPPNAVVMPGARALSKGPAANCGLMLQVAVIIGYRSDDPGARDDAIDQLLE